MKLKKLLALLLAFAMIFTSFSAVAWAGEYEEEYEPELEEDYSALDDAADYYEEYEEEEIPNYNATGQYATINWYNGDQALIYSQKVIEGDAMPEYNLATAKTSGASGSVDKDGKPVKASDVQYDYTFKDENSWSCSNYAATVTGNVTYDFYAQFTGAVRSYDITFVYDETKDPVVLSIPYGYEASYSISYWPKTDALPTPNKDGDAEHSYVFAGEWDPELDTVTGEATYKAKFTEATNGYTVTWKDGDGNFLATDQVPYGETPVYTGSDPTKLADRYYIKYVWTGGWEPELAPMTEAGATYTATFTGEEPVKYDVTWKIGYIKEEGTKPVVQSGDTLYTEKVAYLDTPEYDPTYKPEGAAKPVGQPTIENTKEWTYEFDDTWTNVADPTNPKGIEPIDPTSDAYTGVTYYAGFTKTKTLYTITWKDWDGTVLSTEKLEYGETPEYADTSSLHRADDAVNKNYQFDKFVNEEDGTDPAKLEGGDVKDATYVAQYKGTRIGGMYAISFKDGYEELFGGPFAFVQGTNVSFTVDETTYDSTKKPNDLTLENTAEHVFKGWACSPSEGGTYAPGNSFPTTMPGTDITYTAQWADTVAQVDVNGEVTYYDTLAAAQDYVNGLVFTTTPEPSITVTLLADITAGSFSTSKKVTFDLNGHSFAASDPGVQATAGELTIVNGTITDNNINYIITAAGGNIVLGSGLVVKSTTSALKVGTGMITVNGAIVSNSGEDNKAVFVNDNGTLIVESGSITSEVGGVAIYSSGNTTINGGTISGKGEYETCSIAIGTFTVNGGTVESAQDDAIKATGGTITVNGGTIKAIPTQNSLFVNNAIASIKGGTISSKLVGTNNGTITIYHDNNPGLRNREADNEDSGVSIEEKYMYTTAPDNSSFYRIVEARTVTFKAGANGAAIKDFDFGTKTDDTLTVNIPNGENWVTSIHDDQNAAKVPEATLDNSTALGWYVTDKDGKLTRKFDFENDVITSDLTLTQKWTKTWALSGTSAELLANDDHTLVYTLTNDQVSQDGVWSVTATLTAPNAEIGHDAIVTYKDDSLSETKRLDAYRTVTAKYTEADVRAAVEAWEAIEEDKPAYPSISYGLTIQNDPQDEATLDEYTIVIKVQNITMKTKDKKEKDSDLDTYTYNMVTKDGKIMEYEIIYDAYGGSPEPEAYMLMWGNVIKKPETDPVRGNETFVGWFTKSNVATAETKFEFNVVVPTGLVAGDIVEDEDTHALSIPLTAVWKSDRWNVQLTTMDPSSEGNSFEHEDVQDVLSFAGTDKEDALEVTANSTGKYAFTWVFESPSGIADLAKYKLNLDNKDYTLNTVVDKDKAGNAKQDQGHYLVTVTKEFTLDEILAAAEKEEKLTALYKFTGVDGSAYTQNVRLTVVPQYMVLTDEKGNEIVIDDWKVVPQEVEVTFWTEGEEPYAVVPVTVGEAIAKKDIPADPKTTETDVEFAFWTADPEADKPAAFDFDTKIEKATDLYAYWKPVVDPVTIEAGLNLIAETGINFFFVLAEGESAEDFTAEMTYDSVYQQGIKATTSLANLNTETVGEKTRYMWMNQLYVGSDEMACEAAVTVKNADGEIVAEGTYSVKSIAEEMMEDPQYAPAEKMLAAMLQYGHYAELEFGIYPNKTAIPAAAPAIAPISAEWAHGEDPTTLASYITAFEGALSLDASVGMFIDITPAEGYGLDDYEISVTMDGRQVAGVSEAKMAGGKVEVKVSGIYPDVCVESYEITVKVAGKEATYQRSVMNCAYDFDQKGLAPEVCEALYAYAAAASEYWNQ